MTRGADPAGAREIVLVQPWFEELRRVAPANEGALTGGSEEPRLRRVWGSLARIIRFERPERPRYTFGR